MLDKKKKNKLETKLLLDAIFETYGYDFRKYAVASLNRRIAHRVKQSELVNISDMIPLVINDTHFFNLFLKDMSISVTEMFRDPPFFKAIREAIIPQLKTYPFVKIWHAGCSTGEEVYSMAILLKEEGFYNKAKMYATDYNSHSLEIAKEGLYKVEDVKKYAKTYNQTGGKGSLSDYYIANSFSAKFDSDLKQNITFANHNLAQDEHFGEMNMIICRNVLMYFDPDLQNRVLKLFNRSLVHNGLLCLGQKESLIFSDIQSDFELVDENLSIYRKKKPTSFTPITISKKENVSID